jgi:hypothetical protein
VPWSRMLVHTCTLNRNGAFQTPLRASIGAIYWLYKLQGFHLLVSIRELYRDGELSMLDGQGVNPSAATCLSETEESDD